MPRFARVDRYVARLDLVDQPGLPRPGYAPATRTPEDYLLVDALIARDGLLEYSDGSESWVEYRPASELRDAAASWAARPVTDDHPAEMVSAQTWSEVARGLHMGAPSIEVHDGVTYLRAPLLITSADLLGKIEAGRRELSIGFTSEVIPQEGVSPDGKRFDAVQTKLLGNHTAVVEQGRAGPACRLLMDAAYSTARNPRSESMPITNQKPAAAGARADNLGLAVEQAPYKMPDGSEVMLPTSVIAQLERLAALEAAQSQPMAEGVRAPVPPPPVAPQAPAAAPVAPAPVAGVAPVAAAPTVKPDAPPPPAANAPAAEEDPDKDKEKMTADKIDSMERRFDRRRNLERAAIAVGISATQLDGPTSDERNDEIAREIVKAKCPWLEDAAKTAKGDALDLLVTAAIKQPAPAPRVDANPWAQAQPIQRRVDALDEIEARFLKSQGVAP